MVDNSNKVIFNSVHVSNLNMVSIDPLSKLRPWAEQHPMCPIPYTEWPKDFWGMPFPIDTLTYGKSGRIVPRDPGTIPFYQSLKGEGWPFYPGDTVEIELRGYGFRCACISPVTGEPVQEKRERWRSNNGNAVTEYDYFDKMKYLNVHDFPKMVGTIVARWNYGNEYGERYHVLVGDELLRFENEVKPNEQKCPFMMKLLCGGDFGDRERAKRDCYLKSQMELESEDDNLRNG